MPTWSLTAEVPASDADDLSAILFDAGASGVEVRDGTLAPMPGDAQPPAGRALLIAFFAGREAAGEAARLLPGGGVVAEVPDQDWGEAWKQGLSAFSVGRVFVRPSWIAAQVPADAVEVVLDPGMAFGTGTHPTTALCLAALSDLIAARPGASVLDVGTGSGLLAVAARKLGAGRVVGTDNDPVAVAVARENAERNGAALELSASPLEAVRGPFDIAVANILANTLVELAPAIVAHLAPGGVLLLSGILAPQEPEVRDAYLALGLERLVPDGDLRQGEWSLLALERRR